MHARMVYFIECRYVPQKNPRTRNSCTRVGNVAQSLGVYAFDSSYNPDRAYELRVRVLNLTVLCTIL